MTAPDGTGSPAAPRRERAGSSATHRDGAGGPDTFERAVDVVASEVAATAAARAVREQLGPGPRDGVPTAVIPVAGLVSDMAVIADITRPERLAISGDVTVRTDARALGTLLEQLITEALQTAADDATVEVVLGPRSILVDSVCDVADDERGDAGGPGVTGEDDDGPTVLRTDGVAAMERWLTDGHPFSARVGGVTGACADRLGADVQVARDASGHRRVTVTLPLDAVGQQD